jgi:outer membrane protein assembly factor BamB
MSRLALMSLVCLTLLVTTVHAENWPQWRGAKLDGVSHEKNLPAKFSPTENIAWKLDLPGRAGSTPVVWEDRIYLTSVDEDKLVLIGISTAGKELWRTTVTSGNRIVRDDEGDSASPSPCTDGKQVWAFFANGILGCYTKDGQEVWKMDVQDRYGKLKIAFGMTSTPVLDNGKLYLQLIHGEGDPNTREAVIVCLDAATSKEIWKHDRASDGRAECEHSYASPVLYRDAKQSYLLAHGADYVTAHSLEDGHEIWRCGDLNPKGKYNPTLRFVASPVAAEGIVVVPSAKQGPVYALKADGKGDVTDNEAAFHWKRLKDTPDVPSPLIVDGLVYLCRENGNLICMDAKTGEEYYNERTTPDRHRASPVYADGKIYLCARKGTVTVVKAGKDFEILAKNEMVDSISSSLAISNGRIYVRTFKTLYAVGK